MGVKYITDIGKIAEIPEQERKRLEEVLKHFSFRTNSYYLSLINWNDPEDPIRKIIIPDIRELDAWGDLDASNEAANYVAPGCQHKYPHTVVILVNEVCGGYCRFCFRKRIFHEDNDEFSRDISGALDYVRKVPRITNVLLTGGDPLVLSSKKLDKIIGAVREIDHVKIIRIGTKIPAFNPLRIIDDPRFPEVISRYSTKQKRLYFLVQFNHPREITDEALHAVDIILKAGAQIANQTPILRGINDDPEVLTELMRKLSHAGVPPYYFFQCRPTMGNRLFTVPITEAYSKLEEAKKAVSGLGKRAKYVMSHATGKIEIVGLTDKRIYLKYHRARNPRDESRFMVFARDDNAYWLEDLREIGQPVKDHTFPHLPQREI
ncbi:MAG: KamA family radical SAM protein [Candidatus Zixiibacteriota bacterium]|nr:MAG: KamA family radical SAM protein [candidate division Zixibacteria bacterium]